MSRHTLVTILITAALAACGSKPSSRTGPVSAPSEAPAMAGGGFSTGSGDTHPMGATEAPEHAKPDAPEHPTLAVEPDPAKIKADLLVAETAAWETAKPVFDKACASCHTKSGKKTAKKKLGHFDMTTYPPGGEHKGTIGIAVRDALGIGISGKKSTMPKGKPGSVKGDDLAKIKLWTEAWEAAEQGGAHPPA